MPGVPLPGVDVGWGARLPNRWRLAWGGCRILFLQYQGPTTGQGPIYEGRFDVNEVKPVAEEDLDR